jgi:hypothetical protein
MAKSAFYSEEKAKEEKVLKEKTKIEDEKRKFYLDKLRKDRNFQKYVVEDIIRKNIESLTDTRLLKVESRTKEELADVIIANIKASSVLTNIFNNLI